MTAPLFNLPLTTPIAGSSVANGGGQAGALGGFEALLAAFFGNQGEPTADGLFAGQPNPGEAPPADEKAAADTAPPLAVSNEALNLAALIAAQPQAQAGQAPPPTQATQPAGASPAAAKAAAEPATPFAAPAAAQPKPPEPLQQADAPADQIAAPLATAEDAAPPAAETPAAAKTTAPARAETPAADVQAPHAASPARAEAPVAAPPPPVAAPVQKAAVETVQAPPPLEAAAEAEAPVEPPSAPASGKPARHADPARRAVAASVAAPAPPPADEAVLPTAVAAAATADAAAEPASALESEPAVPAAREPAQQAATPDTPDVASAPAAPAAAHHAHAASAHLAPARASAETIANLTAQIGKKLDGRSTRFDVELTPAGLGHVSVAVEIAASGKMTAAMSFDSPQAAAELRARSHELQRALEQAGFDLSGGLSFDVAGDGGRGLAQQQQQQQHDGAAWRGRAFQAVLGTAGEVAETAASAALQYTRRSEAGVDIRI